MYGVLIVYKPDDRSKSHVIISLIFNNLYLIKYTIIPTYILEKVVRTV
jgi:hypothetical protein